MLTSEIFMQSLLQAMQTCCFGQRWLFLEIMDKGCFVLDKEILMC